jgi:hypothetical protein
VLFEDGARENALKQIGAFAVAVQEQEGGSSHHAFLPGALFAGRLIQLDVDEVDLPTVVSDYH